MDIWRRVLFTIATSWLLPESALAQERSYEWGWAMHPMWWMGGVWGIAMMFMMFLFWILVIVGFGLAVRWLLSAGKLRRGDSALEILRQRYARGEIDKNEFEAKKKDLGA
jgi:putative membrane protein